MIGDPKADTVLMEAIQSAALVRYCRCHATGVRTAFLVDSVLVARLPEELQRFHRHIDALRDRHIAHSVNDWELEIPFAQVRIDGDRKEVVAVNVQGHRMIGLARQDIESLEALAKRLHDLVYVEYEAERARVLAAVKQMPIEELERRMREPTPLPGIGPVDKARGR
jgi:hypothetical protein